MLNKRWKKICKYFGNSYEILLELVREYWEELLSNIVIYILVLETWFVQPFLGEDAMDIRDKYCFRLYVVPKSFYNISFKFWMKYDVLKEKNI